MAMKIGLVLDVFTSYTSGVTNYVVLLKSWLEKNGCEVHVFAFGRSDSSDPDKNIHISPGLVLPNGYGGGIRFHPSSLALLRQMDIIHLHHPFVSGPLARRALTDLPTPFVFTNHTRYDLYTHAYLPWIPPGTGRWLCQHYMPSFCNKMDLVISPSAGIREVMRDWGVTSAIEVIPNGVHLSPFRSPHQPILPEDMGFNKNDFIWTFVGRLAPEKNVLFLAQTMLKVIQRFHKAGFLVVGEGPMRSIMEGIFQAAGLRDRACFTGLVPYSRVPDYLSAAHGFCTASVTEVHPLTLIEAMAASLPTVGIASPGISDTIQDGENGFVCSPVELFDRLCEITQDNTLHKRLSEGANRTAEKYSIQRTTQRTLENYDRLVITRKQKRL